MLFGETGPGKCHEGLFAARREGREGPEEREREKREREEREERGRRKREELLEREEWLKGGKKVGVYP